MSIETLVGEHVALRRSGRNLMGLCPFHKEKSPSFVVSPERGSFHCFGCGVGGDIFQFYMLAHKVEFPDAMKALAARTGVELDPEAARRKATETRSFDVLQAVCLYFQQALAGKAGSGARQYLSKRGISAETIERFGLGYLADWGEGLRRDLPARGVSEAELIETGVLITSEQSSEPFCAFHGRLIFPIRDIQGRVCGFGGRILGDGQPKYLNSRQSALFDKSAVLYTIERAASAIRSTGVAVIVEGYMDALRAHQDGFNNVVASLGTAITVRQLSLLARLHTKDSAPLRTVLALDADPAGARAAAEAGVRATVALRQPPPTSPGVAIGKTIAAPLELRIATLPAGKDPDEVIAEDPRLWSEAIANAAPVMDHLFDLVLAGLDQRQPSFTQDILSQMLPLIGLLPGVGQQQPYLERLQQVTRIETAALRGELARLRGEAQRGKRAPSSRLSEIAQLRQAAQARDPRQTIEDELLCFLLNVLPLGATTLEALDGMVLTSSGNRALLKTLIDAQRESAADALTRMRERLAGDDLEIFERILAMSPPPAVEAAKVPGAVRAYRLRLERLRQSDRLREQGALLDQLDAESVRAVLGPTQDLVASRHDLNRRMLEEQAEYHLQ